MSSGAHEQATSTLSDLERQLVELEAELLAVAEASAPPPPPPPAPLPPPISTAAPAPPPQPVSPGSGTSPSIEELVGFREQLRSATAELLEEYDRLVARQRERSAATPAPPSPSAVAEPVAPQRPVAAFVPTPPHLPPRGAEAAGRHDAPRAHEAPRDPHPQAGPAPGDEPMLEGAIAVDAGPFDDIATLAGFEQALGRVSGAGDVHIRSFEARRAVIAVHLAHPVALARELRNLLPMPINVTEAHDGRLSVDLDARTHGT